MVSVRKIKSDDLDALSAIQVHPDQLPFVGTIGDVMRDAPRSWHFHVIEDEGRIVGFFNIDTGYSDNYDFTQENELGLRAFLISAAEQGNGYGKAAVLALKPYLKYAYANFSSIALTVNCKNPAAYQCYLNGGFEDTESLYLGGGAGPQHIMRMSLSAP